VGGRHPNTARDGLPSHFASVIGALVWSSPTDSELCNSHRAKQQRDPRRGRVLLSREAVASLAR